MISAGIIGMGVGRHHLRALKKHPLVKNIVVCDKNWSWLRKYYEDCEKESSINDKNAQPITPPPTVAINAEEILKNPEINLVSIATYDDSHLELALKSLKAGKHVLIEKPMCLTLDGAKQLRQALKENQGLKLSCNLNLRTNPRFKNIKKEVDSNEFGELFYIEADYLWGRISRLTDGWRKSQEHYSVVHGAAVHVIDLILWIVGKLPVKVFGMGNQISSSGSGFKFRDFASILMEFENGLVAKATANAGCVHPHYHNLKVYGTKKTYTHDISGGLFFNSRESAKPLVDELDYPANQLKYELIHSYIDFINGKIKKPIVTEREAFNALSVCLAAEKSLETRKLQTVEYI